MIFRNLSLKLIFLIKIYYTFTKCVFASTEYMRFMSPLCILTFIRTCFSEKTVNLSRYSKIFCQYKNF
jgi:hypothetical protein